MPPNLPLTRAHARTSALLLLPPPTEAPPAHLFLLHLVLLTLRLGSLLLSALGQLCLLKLVCARARARRTGGDGGQRAATGAEAGSPSLMCGRRGRPSAATRPVPLDALDALTFVRRLRVQVLVPHRLRLHELLELLHAGCSWVRCWQGALIGAAVPVFSRPAWRNVGK
jgi:hypothetical protein